MADLSDEELEQQLSDIALRIASDLGGDPTVTISERISGFKAIASFWSMRKRLKPEDKKKSVFDEYQEEIERSEVSHEEDGD